MNKKLISIFTPVYNEERNVQKVYEEIKTVMLTLTDIYDFEHVFSDNASTDTSREILREIQEKDKNVKVILLSKNFGITKSSLNGLFRCKGDAVVQIDADLQDPPQMTKDFIKQWEQGYKVVYGVREDRAEGLLMKNVRKAFYRAANMISYEVLIPDVGEFRLMDRRIIEELRKIHDCNPYLRGLIANLGFRQKGIPYRRERRKEGKTSGNLLRLIDYGLNGIVNHSSILLRLSTITGVFLAGLSFVLVVFYVMAKIVTRTPPHGITTIIVLVLLFSGIQMIFLGILGEYIAKIFSQSIKRPLVIEEELLGFHDSVDS